MNELDEWKANTDKASVSPFTKKKKLPDDVVTLTHIAVNRSLDSLEVLN
jgi:hypothetical protein